MLATGFIIVIIHLWKARNISVITPATLFTLETAHHMMYCDIELCRNCKHLLDER